MEELIISTAIAVFGLALGQFNVWNERKRSQALIERERAESQAFVERERAESQAFVERERLEAEAFAERERLAAEAFAERARLAAEAFAEREHTAAQAIAAKESRKAFLAGVVMDTSIPRENRVPFYEEYISLGGNGPVLKLWATGK